MSFQNRKIDLGEADKERVLMQLTELKNGYENEINVLKENINKIDQCIREIEGKEYIFIKLEYNPEGFEIKSLERRQ